MAWVVHRRCRNILSTVSAQKGQSYQKLWRCLRQSHLCFSSEVKTSFNSFCPSRPALVGPSPFKCIYSLLVKGNSEGTARYYWAGCSLCKQHLLNICNIPETVLSSFSMINFVQSSYSPLGESCSPQCIKARALGSFMIPENSAPFTALLGAV